MWFQTCWAEWILSETDQVGVDKVFQFYICPFAEMQEPSVWLCVCNSSSKTTQRAIRLSHVIEIAGHNIFLKSEATTLTKLRNARVLEFHITFALNLNSQQHRDNIIQMSLLCLRPISNDKGMIYLLMTWIVSTSLSVSPLLMIVLIPVSSLILSS